VENPPKIGGPLVYPRNWKRVPKSLFFKRAFFKGTTPFPKNPETKGRKGGKKENSKKREKIKEESTLKWENPYISQ